MISNSVIPPARSNPQMYTKMCVASPHIFCWNGDYHVVSNHQVLSSSQWYVCAKGAQTVSDWYSHEIVWHPKNAETQGNLGAHIEPDKSTYCDSVCKQEEGQPAQLFQNGINCSRIVLCIWTSRIMNGQMTCFAKHAPAVSISNQNLSWHSSFSRKPRWRTCAGVVVFEESCDREGVIHTWQPYRPAVDLFDWFICWDL